MTSYNECCIYLTTENFWSRLIQTYHFLLLKLFLNKQKNSKWKMFLPSLEAVQVTKNNTHGLSLQFCAETNSLKIIRLIFSLSNRNIVNNSAPKQIIRVISYWHNKLVQSFSFFWLPKLVIKPLNNYWEGCVGKL